MNRVWKQIVCHDFHYEIIVKSNRNNLLDFCKCISEILVKSNIIRAVQKGFITNSMIDEGYKHYLLYSSILKIIFKNF